MNPGEGAHPPYVGRFLGHQSLDGGVSVSKDRGPVTTKGTVTST